MPTPLKNEYVNSLSINKIRKRIKTKNGIKQATRQLWRIVGVETQEPSHTFGRESKWWDQWTISLAVAIHTYPSPTPTCLALLLTSVKSANVDTCLQCFHSVTHRQAVSVNCLGGSWLVSPLAQPGSMHPAAMSRVSSALKSSDPGRQHSHYQAWSTILSRQGTGPSPDCCRGHMGEGCSSPALKPFMCWNTRESRTHSFLHFSTWGAGLVLPFL